MVSGVYLFFFFFKQKTAYEMRISDWSSDVCSSDLANLIWPIGEWVLRRACEEAARWPSKLRVAVNVSPIQFANEELPKIVANALATTGLAPDRLELEITESVFLGDSNETARMFKALKGLGVRLALDDFGTGYSSLGYLQSEPFDKIKTDQSFVRGENDPGSRNGQSHAANARLGVVTGRETTARKDKPRCGKECGRM